jgi:hypothetical protein
MSMPACIDLVLDNGEIVRIEGPTKYEDEMWQLVEDSMKRRDWMSANRYDGWSASYLGLSIQRVNMARVVATL